MDLDSEVVTPNSDNQGSLKPEDARGIHTTEFWLTLLIVLVGVLAEYQDSEHHWLSIAAGASVILYKLGRFSLKIRRSKYSSDVDAVMVELALAKDELHKLIKEVKSNQKGNE